MATNRANIIWPANGEGVQSHATEKNSTARLARRTEGITAQRNPRSLGGGVARENWPTIGTARAAPHRLGGQTPVRITGAGATGVV